MSKNKTRLVIHWPDGETEYPRRTSRGWQWTGVVYDDDGKARRHSGWMGTWSSHLDSVKRGVADAGGTITREPNPYYQEPKGLNFDWFTAVLRG